MNETFGPHSVACQAHALICAVENLRDEDGQKAFDFRIAVQEPNKLLAMADSYLDFDNWPDMAHEVCKCAVAHLVYAAQSILDGMPQRAQQHATACLDEGLISPSDYIFLVKWTEGRVK